jgi:hypothetical protein
MTFPANPDRNQSDNEDIEGWMDSPSITEKSLLEACGRSVYAHLRTEIMNFQDECSVDAPAMIKTVSFSGDLACILVQIPFRLPRPTGDPDDRIPSNAALQRFQDAFRTYLREQQAGKQLSNLFYKEFGNFLLRYLGAYKLRTLRSGELLRKSIDGPLTVKESLLAIVNQFNARRFSGPRMLRPPKTSAVEKDKFILEWIEDMRNKIGDRMKHELFEDDASLRDWLRGQYEGDEYPWVKYLKNAFGRLTGLGAKNRVAKASLRIPESWSSRELGRCILWEKWRAEYGEEYPVKAIDGFLEKADKLRQKVK